MRYSLIGNIRRIRDKKEAESNRIYDIKGSY